MSNVNPYAARVAQNSDGEWFIEERITRTFFGLFPREVWVPWGKQWDWEIFLPYTYPTKEKAQEQIDKMKVPWTVFRQTGGRD